VKLEDDRLTLAIQTDGFNRAVKVGVGDDVREIKAGESYTFGT
jgi:hypothetical protein